MHETGWKQDLDSLVQQKSGRDSHWRFLIRQLFCYTSGSERRHLKPIVRVSYKTKAVVLALIIKTHRFFLSSSSHFFIWYKTSFCCSSFPASLEAGPSQAGDTRIPLPCKSLGHSHKIVVCKVGLCTSLRIVTEFLNKTLRKFYTFSDSRQTWTSLTLQSADWPISRQHHRPQMRKREFYPGVGLFHNPWLSQPMATRHNA